MDPHPGTLLVRKSLVMLVLCSLVLTACQSPKIATSSTLRITFSPDGAALSPTHITAGQVITLALENSNTTREHTLLLVTTSVSDAQLPIPTRDLIFETHVAAGQLTQVQFTAPRAAGTYQFICSQPGHGENGEVLKIVVVHPDYAR